MDIGVLKIQKSQINVLEMKSVLFVLKYAAKTCIKFQSVLKKTTHPLLFG